MLTKYQVNVRIIANQMGNKRGKRAVNSMVLKTGPERKPEKGVVPVSVVRPGSNRLSN